MAFRPLGCPYGRELVGVKGGRSHRKCPKQMGAAMRRQRWGWGGWVITSSRPGPGQWVVMARVLESCRTQSSACSLGPPAHSLAQDEVTWRAPRKRLGFASYLSPPEIFTLSDLT